jgi:hypothetical protein
VTGAEGVIFALAIAMIVIIALAWGKRRRL